MSIHKITSRYAKSIIELGKEQGFLDEIIKNASFFKEVTKNREFANLLKNPVFKPEIKLKVFSKLFKKNVNPIFYRFLELVIKKNRESLLPEIMNEILVQYKSMQKITDLTLITAVEVPQDFIKKLEKVLKKGSIIEENVEIH
ncbi:MAG TPA: ATP synthase F1 subunit delta, partial [Bacteroidetes bacterium]|nr:ATP synthase F1 subunit delta [Bacteroidota bacterium]